LLKDILISQENFLKGAIDNLLKINSRKN